MTPTIDIQAENQALNDPQSPIIAIVIPLYNHAETLEKVVNESRRFSENMIVVDDGSNDGVGEVLSRLDPTVHLLRHPKNLGKGAAILSGSRKARELNATHIITIDADGQHYSDDIPGFIEAVHETPEAIILGCRDFAATYVPKSSDFGRRFRPGPGRRVTGLNSLSSGSCLSMRRNRCGRGNAGQDNSGFSGVDRGGKSGSKEPPDRETGRLYGGRRGGLRGRKTGAASLRRRCGCSSSQSYAESFLSLIMFAIKKVSRPKNSASSGPMTSDPKPHSQKRSRA